MASAGSGSAKPWLLWPWEIPDEQEIKRNPEFAHFQFLTSDENRLNLLNQVRDKVFQATDSLTGAILLAGGTSAQNSFYDNDTTMGNYFRQEPYFRYVFGVNEPECFGFLDLRTKETIGVITRLNDDAVRWNGVQFTPEQYCAKYGWDQCVFIDDIPTEFKERNFSEIHVLDGVNSDSGIRTQNTATNFFKELGLNVDDYTIDTKSLYPILTECRVIKTPLEIEYIRHASYVGSQSHMYMMRHSAPKLMERQMEAYYKTWTGIYGGSRYLSYGCIACAGKSGSILHYGHAGRPNNQILQDGDMCLMDLGSEFKGYATDITVSFPVNGKFTADQRAIYDIVYKANMSVQKMMRPGISWTDMHRLSESIVVEGLLDIGLLQGDLSELVKSNISTLFYPHGLGHFIGMVVHDVGGYTDDEPKSNEPGLQWLRTTRILKAGMVITVEPGIYFNEFWLELELNKRPHLKEFINHEMLERFIDFGGVRLEDMVLVTEDGSECLSILPRTPDEIEEAMRPICRPVREYPTGPLNLAMGAALGAGLVAFTKWSRK